MTAHTKPPFRADHVGSLLRPKALLAARERCASGEITKSELREIEDEAIRDAIAFQEEIGLNGITDGEYRRTFFHIDFLEQIEGMQTEMSGIGTKFHRQDGEVEFSPPKLKTVGKLKRTNPILAEDFVFLQGVTRKTPKITMPSPSMAHFRGGRDAIEGAAYPDLEEFFVDLARVYREEIADLAARGCRYIQLDDTNLAYLCDPAMREGARRRGEDPDQLPLLYARLINEAVRDRPDDLVVSVHLCRGNFRSAWVAEGGYDLVAEVLFNEINVDAFFLEYDSPRAGDFSPLHYVPHDKHIVLGLVSSKTGALEAKDDLKRRIDVAAALTPLDRLCISPQCGFSSTVHGNDITVDDQRRKLELVVEVAREVWGG